MGAAIAVKSRKPLYAAIAAVVVVTIALALWWFQPYKALIDDRVDEALPLASPPAAEPAGGPTDAEVAGPAPTPAPAPAEMVTLARGDIRSLDHDSSGRAMVLELPDGARVLRFEDLDTDNGPDLRVYLSTAPADGPPDAFDDDFIDLGGLKGNIGNQNYDLPADIDLDRYQSVVVWCRRFAVGFAVAPLD